jgi:hypothetical protein
MRLRDIVMAAATQGGGAASPPGAPELWPQPDFASSAGIIFSAGGGMEPTIGGGVLTFFDDGDPSTASATALQPLVAGTYHYELTVDSVTGPGVGIGAGNYGVGGSSITAPGAYSGDFEIGGDGGDSIEITAGFTAATFSHFSLKKVP